MVIFMARTTTVQHPAVQALLRELGENIKLARLRRGFSMQLVADRAGMSRTTLRSVEQGKASNQARNYKCYGASSILHFRSKLEIIWVINGKP